VTVKSTPKYHCEMAGEGVEFDWALSKNWFKRTLLKNRKTSSQFLAMVRRAISTEVMTVARVRKCARRARAYICAYNELHNSKGETKLIFLDIEKLVKIYRCHRNAADFDKGFGSRLLGDA
jgi:hypothetical protein